jgi:PAS domain S-box-containing protein
MHAHPFTDTPAATRPVWGAYLLALACSGAAFLAEWVLRPWLAATPCLLLVAGIMVAARWAGRGPAWLALSLSALLAQTFLVDGMGAPLLGTLLFAAVGGLAVTLSERRLDQHAPVPSGAPDVLAPAMLQSCPDPILATDAHGAVSYLNPAAARLLGSPGPRAPGRPLAEVLHLLQVDTRERVTPAVSQGGGSVPAAGWQAHPRLLLREDGTELPIEERVAPVLGRDGEVMGALVMLRDASERHRLERECAGLLEREHAALREAQAQRERMESLFRQAPVAIALFQGPEHRCELLNPHALSLLNTRDSIIGRPLRELVPELNPGLLRLLDDVFHSGVPFSGQQVPLMLGHPRENVAPEGQGRFFDLTWLPWRGAGGAIQGVMSVAVEVTGLVHARRGAEALAEELRQALQTRDEFLSIASHELKTPITSLQLQLELLRRSAAQPEPGAELPAAVRKRAEAAMRPVARLHQLVGTLLDVSRIRAGRLDLQRERVDLAALVQDLVGRAQEDAATVGCRLHVEVDGPLEGHWDRMRLEQVITNLLSNAFKYGAHRPVEVRVSRQDGQACLTVRDHGIGIPPEDHERIFQRYERAVSERHYGGFGLGLWIVRQILESLQGDIHVHSQPGQGATFTVRLPLDTAASAVA